MDNDVTKKSHMGLLISILVVIIIILSGVIVYPAFFKGDSTNKVKETNESNKKKSSDEKPKTKDDNNDEKPKTKDDNNDEETIKTLTDDEITDLIKFIKKYELFTLRNSDKKVTFSKDKLTDDMLYSLFYFISGKDDSFIEHWDNQSTWYITKESADEYFNKAFGFKPNAYSDLICSNDNEPLLIYDKDNNRFYYNDEHPGHGGLVSGFADYLVTSSSKEGNKYTIDALFLWGNIADGYYINDEEFNPSVDDYLDEEDFDKAEKKEFKKVDPSDYSKYSFEFEKTNDGFIIKSISLKK